MCARAIDIYIYNNKEKEYIFLYYLYTENYFAKISIKFSERIKEI